jgi:hypothetical protein
LNTSVHVAFTGLWAYLILVLGSALREQLASLGA